MFAFREHVVNQGRSRPSPAVLEFVEQVGRPSRRRPFDEGHRLQIPAGQHHQQPAEEEPAQQRGGAAQKSGGQRGKRGGIPSQAPAARAPAPPAME